MTQSALTSSPLVIICILWRRPEIPVQYCINPWRSGQKIHHFDFVKNAPIVLLYTVIKSVYLQPSQHSNTFNKFKNCEKDNLTRPKKSWLRPGNLTSYNQFKLATVKTIILQMYFMHFSPLYCSLMSLSH